MFWTKLKSKTEDDTRDITYDKCSKDEAKLCERCTRLPLNSNALQDALSESLTSLNMGNIYNKHIARIEGLDPSICELCRVLRDQYVNHPHFLNLRSLLGSFADSRT